MAGALTFKPRVLLATPLPATWMSSVVIHNVYVKFYTDVIGLEAKYVGWVYLAFNIWNILNDPVFGVILDKIDLRPVGLGGHAIRYRHGRAWFELDSETGDND